MKSALLAAAAAALVVAGADASETHWDYSDVDAWAELAPVCGNGTRQSPIDIVTESAVYSETALALTASGDGSALDGTLANNGHALQWTVATDADNVPSLTTVPGVSANATYKLAQFHLHWGSTGSQGSEHTLNGVAAPAELHFVHFDVAYGSLSGAAAQPDGLAVVGVFVDEGEHNEALADLIEALLDPHMQVPAHDGAEPHEVVVNVSALLPGNLTTRFFTYPGSLTTPNCSESVTWLVAEGRVQMSAEQLSILRNSTFADENATEALSDNYRPVQGMHEREVVMSWVDDSPAATMHASAVVSALAFAAAMLK